MKKLIVAVVLITFLIFPQQLQNSYALSCAEPDSPDIAYDKHDAVIIGTIIKVEEQSGANTKVLTVKVDKSYKGINTKIVTIDEMLAWSESYVDQTKLFFLVMDEDRWFNSLCGPTTTNIALADQYFSDKTELQLLDEVVVEELINDDNRVSLSEHNSTKTSQQEQPKRSKHTPTILAIVFALFLIFLTVAFVLKRKHR